MCGESVLWTEWMHTNECPVTFQNEKLSSRDVYSAKPHTHADTGLQYRHRRFIFSIGRESESKGERETGINTLSVLSVQYLFMSKAFIRFACARFLQHTQALQHAHHQGNKSIRARDELVPRSLLLSIWSKLSFLSLALSRTHTAFWCMYGECRSECHHINTILFE